MNSRNENEDNEKINFSDDSEGWLNKEDSLFRSKMPLDIPNYKNDNNDENDGEQEFYEGLDREEFDFLGDGDSNLQNFLNPNRSNVNRKTLSLNNEIGNYEKLYDYNDEQIMINDRNKSTMTFSGPNLIENSTFDIPEIDKSEIPEELGRLYVKADWKLIYDQLKVKGYTLRKINDEIGSNFRNNLYADRSMRLASFQKLKHLFNEDISYSFIISTEQPLSKTHSRITISSLAKEYGLSENRVFRIPEHKSLLQNEAAKLYIEGCSYEEIGKRMEIAKKTISEWITKYKIMDPLFKVSTNLNNNKILNSIQINLNENNIQDLANNSNLRQADYILKHQTELMLSLVDFIKKNFNNLNFEIININDITGLPINLLKDWLTNSRLLNSINLSLSDQQIIEKFEGKHIRADWDKMMSILQKQGFTKSQIFKQTGVDLGSQIRNKSLMSNKKFQKIKHRYDLDTDGEFKYKFENKIINSKKDHSLILPRNKTSAEFTGVMLGDGHASYEIKIALDANQKFVINHIDELIHQVFKEKISSKREAGTNKWVFRSKKQSFVNGVVGLGIKKGNKTVNQIDVPNWIKNNSEFHTPLIKGLVDTDGSVFISKNGLTANISNKSVPILDFVETYCQNQKIKYRRDTNNRPKVEIGRIEDVKNFLRIVKPRKLWELNKKKPYELRKYFPVFPSLD